MNVVALAAAIIAMASTDNWTPRWFRGASGQMRAMEYARLLKQESEAVGLDPLLVASVVQSESSWRPRAVGKDGEHGLLQVFPHTCPAIASHRGAVRCGVEQLAALRRKCGDPPERWVGAYNWARRGSGGCEAADPGYPARILARYERFKPR